jgi:hypothetical protein
MFILHIVGHSFVRFTPGRIATCWGRYTPHTSRFIATKRHGGIIRYRESLNPYGVLYVGSRADKLKDLVSKADVIHCHDDEYPTRITTSKDKILVYQAHIGDIPKRLFRTRRVAYSSRVRHACITNGYGRKFDDEEKRSRVPWGRLPDILDLDHPVYRPDYSLKSADEEELRVVFTFSNKREFGSKINAKSPKGTGQAIGQIEDVNLSIVGGVSFELAMAMKRKAHIVLDEIFSPYTHLSALEGAAVGACVLVNYDDYTVKELCDYVGAPRDSYPFVRVTPQTVRRELHRFRDHKEEAIEIGKRSREWMEKYYHQTALLQKYLEFYNK